MAYQFTNEQNIWCLKENHPELVVQDCRREFHLSEIECDRLREILLERGVNKWLYCRLLFLDLKHEIKASLRIVTDYEDARHIRPHSRMWYLLQELNNRMQQIAKTPRFVVWGRKPHRHMKNNKKEIVVKGRHC